MKLLITILQHRRVVLPYLFLKHSLPVLRKHSDVPVVVHLIQHSLHANLASRDDSALLPVEKETLVDQWTSAGRYSEAVISRHDERFDRYPSIPSRRIGAEFAATLDYDLHLWLEDDSFLYDDNCHEWPEQVAGNLVGSFGDNSFGYVNSAYYLCKPSMDLLLLSSLRDPGLWDLNASMYCETPEGHKLNLSAPRIEPTITRLANGKIAQLSNDVVARYNSRKPPSTQKLRRLLQQVCPDEVSLLAEDFPDWS